MQYIFTNYILLLNKSINPKHLAYSKNCCTLMSKIKPYNDLPPRVYSIKLL